MAIWDPPAEIGILLYPGVAFATVHGLTDLFTVASTLACVFDTHPDLADYGSFRRVFQKVVGLTPSDYRRRFAVA